MKRRAAVALAAAVLILAGCAPAVDTGWSPPTWSAGESRVVDDAPVPVAAADLGLDAQRIRNDAVGLQARFAYLGSTGSLDAFNDAVTGVVAAAIDGSASRSGIAYRPTVWPRGSGLGDRDCVTGSTALAAAAVLADPVLGPADGVGTAVVCDIVVAAGSILAERIRTVTGGPDGVAADSMSTVFVDVATGETAPASELWTDDAAQRLGGSIVDAMRRDLGALSLKSPAPLDPASIDLIRSALQTVVIAKDRGIIVTVPAGFSSSELQQLGAPPTSAPVVVEVPTEVAAPVLSAFGTTVVAAAGLPFSAPPAVAAGFRDVDCDLVPCIAITYDDGPSEFTAGILDELAAHESAVTFFAMGEKADQFDRVLARAVVEGHEVENHTWNHPHLLSLTRDQVAKQIRDTTAALTAVTGTPIRAFRPPYGEQDAAVLAAAGLPAILWDLDTFDWQGPPEDVLIGRAVDQPRVGSIVLMHDIQPVTAKTAGAVYEGLRDRGFTLVTVHQLLGELPASGAIKRAP